MEKVKKKRRPAAAKPKERTWVKIRNVIRTDYYDYNLVLGIVLLTCFGLITLYSASAYTALNQEGNDMFYFKKQAFISVGGLFGALIVSLFDYHKLKKYVTTLYVASLVLMLLVMTPLGVESHGAKRWLKLGPLPQFQPAEVAKIAVIVCLAYMIVQMGRNVRSLKACSVLFMMGGIQAFVAYRFTDNLSTAIIIFSITVGLIFLSHPEWRWFIILAVAGVILIGLAVFMFYVSVRSVDENTPFRIRRIYYWLHPGEDAENNGYQTLQALYAIGSGGFFGRGFGNGIQKLGRVPEAQNDMIFSIICEEWGVFGAIVVMLLFSFLLYRLVFIARNAPDLFGTLIVSGIFIHIALQVIFNIAVVCALMPNTGVTLPFISYGGTSIVFLMIEMGIALSVSRRIRFRDPVNG